MTNGYSVESCQESPRNAKFTHLFALALTICNQITIYCWLAATWFIVQYLHVKATTVFPSTAFWGEATGKQPSGFPMRADPSPAQLALIHL
jgi:hypothetical protein